jgi:alpha-L-arabinofuranosidase
MAAVNLNIFHTYSERVHMANIAQMVNVLQAMILTDNEKMIVTPTYHVFEMYTPFQDSTYVPVKFGNLPQVRSGDITIPAISASAAIGKDRKLYLALVNLDPQNSIEISTRIAGFEISAATGRVLSGDQMDSHNTFSAPDTVSPAPFTAKAKGNIIHFNLPAKSVVVLQMD